MAERETIANIRLLCLAPHTSCGMSFCKQYSIASWYVIGIATDRCVGAVVDNCFGNDFVLGADCRRFELSAFDRAAVCFEPQLLIMQSFDWGMNAARHKLCDKAR